MRVRLSAKLDPKAKRGRPDLDKGAAQEKALGHGSIGRAPGRERVELAGDAVAAKKAWKAFETCEALE